MTPLEADLVYFGDLCHWQPDEIMRLPSKRRQALSEVIRFRHRPSNTAQPNDAASIAPIKPLAYQRGRR